jgi:hypothetical protein
MSTQPGLTLETLLGDVDDSTRQALRENEAAIREHVGDDQVIFVGRATSSDGQHVDRGAFVYLTNRVLGVAVDGKSVNGFPSKHITGVLPGSGSSVLLEARPVHRSFEFQFDDIATQRRFLDAATR